jgi:hypothetical protein
MTDVTVLALQALVALGGSVVVVQSYRGYVRNGSRPLAFFGIGIGLLTVGPPVLTAVFTLAGPAPGLLETVLLMRVAGLLSLLHAFTRA